MPELHPNPGPRKLGRMNHPIIPIRCTTNISVNAQHSTEYGADKLPQPAEQITVQVDGGSRGNPGPAAAAFIITDKNKNQLVAKALYLGKTTNNVAEYTALVKALEAASQIDAEQITILSDSELLVKQINGQYKVKSQQIIPLFRQASDMLANFQKYSLRHVSREKNKKADRLVNQALNLERDVEEKPLPKTKTTAHSKKPIRLGVLISGGGRTVLNILEHIKTGKLNAQITVVISSRSAVAGVERAKNAGLDVKIIRKKDYPDIDRFSTQIEKELVTAKVELVIQGGWLCLWKIPKRYQNKVMNIHPALLPSFGGAGMWGHHVHQAVLDAGCKVSGCTVHFCTNEYDEGPIILQRACPVENNDNPDTLAARVFEQECIAYPHAIKLFEEGKITVQDNKVKIKT
jgi:phosphoribosylglycinamide formyltransferase-1